MVPHPLGSKARVLLTSVFGPYAQDDEFGSRAINPMELYHNQVTREQGPFSLRMFHRSWGLMLIQENISAPSHAARFPDARALRRGDLPRSTYDIVGISSIIVNVGKVREMCRLVRAALADVHDRRRRARRRDSRHRADGRRRSHREGRGHPLVAAVPRRGRSTGPSQHPVIPSSFGFRLIGLRAPRGGGNPAATIIPSVGCPMGCNFCTTSAFFGGKGKFVNFFETGEELFQRDVRGGGDARRVVVLHDGRELPAPQEAGARAARADEGARQGVVAVRVLVGQRHPRSTRCASSWSSASTGSGSGSSRPSELREAQRHRHAGADARAAVARHPRAGLDDHRPGAPHAREHRAPRSSTPSRTRPTFHQFMLYTPMPGTPLYAQMQGRGPAARTSISPTSTASTSSTSRTRTSRATLSKPLLDRRVPPRLRTQRADACSG